MITGLIALTLASLFAGAALYINVAEQPARLGLENRAMLAEWKPAYKRGTRMQAPLAVIGFIFGMVSWWQTGNLLWVASAIMMIANLPVTFMVIWPTNTRLMRTNPQEAGPDSRKLIIRWGKLHGIRSALGVGAVAASLMALAR